MPSKRQSKTIKSSYQRLVYRNEYKAKSENKNITNKYRYFLKSNFVGVNKLFVLAYKNEDIASKNLKLKDIIYQKELLVIIMSSSMGKTFLINQLIQILNDNEKIRKLTAGQGEDYTTGCLLDYVYIKNHYRLIAVDLSRQK